MATAEPFERPVNHVEDIEPQKKYVVVGPHYWGFGLSIVEARDNFRKHGGTVTPNTGIMIFDEDTEFFGIDQMGRYEYKGNPPEEGKLRRPTAK